MVDRNHPSVDRVVADLESKGLDIRVTWLDDAATTAQAAADALGTEVGAIANSLIFTLDDQPILVLTSGRHRVDTAWLGGRLGGTLRRAPAETVRQSTGQVIGGVAPVGHPEPLPTYVDVVLSDYPKVWAAAGHAHTVFPLTFSDLVRVTGATVTPVEP
ncbi:MAG: YbaK/EbsC family protein [Candidatus Nanopelagicales bacterium]